MGRYEITDRGRIIISVLLVIILLVIPAAVFAIRSASAKAGTEPEKTPSALVTESPGVNSPDPEYPVNSTPPGQAESDALQPVVPSDPFDNETNPPIVTNELDIFNPDNPPNPSDTTNPPTDAESLNNTNSQTDPESPSTSSPPTVPESPEPNETSDITHPHTDEKKNNDTQNSDGSSTNPSPGNFENSDEIDVSVLSFIFRPKARLPINRAVEKAIHDFLSEQKKITGSVLIAETGTIENSSRLALIYKLKDILDSQGFIDTPVDHVSFNNSENEEAIKVTIYFSSILIK